MSTRYRRMPVANTVNHFSDNLIHDPVLPVLRPDITVLVDWVGKHQVTYLLCWCFRPDITILVDWA